MARKNPWRDKKKRAAIMRGIEMAAAKRRQHPLDRIVADAEKCADFYEVQVGMTGDPRVVPDIYRTIARLARCLPRQYDEDWI